MTQHEPPVKFVNTNLGLDKLTAREVNEIHRAGYRAAWDDHLTIDACPYRRNPETGTTYDPLRARVWVTGFSAAQTDLRILRDGPQGEGPQPYAPVRGT